MGDQGREHRGKQLEAFQVLDQRIICALRAMPVVFGFVQRLTACVDLPTRIIPKLLERNCLVPLARVVVLAMEQVDHAIFERVAGVGGRSPLDRRVSEWVIGEARVEFDAGLNNPGFEQMLVTAKCVWSETLRQFILRFRELKRPLGYSEK